MAINMNKYVFLIKNAFLNIMANFGGAQRKHQYGVFLFNNRNFEKAFIWYKKSSDLGYSVAIHDLANIYDTGYGAEENLNLAIELYQKAANLGEPMSMWNLATIYMPNYKPEHDVYLAYLWILRAQKFGLKNPALIGLANYYQPKYREYMLEKEGEVKVRECEAEANNWSPQQP